MIFYKKFLNGHLPLSIANVLSLQNINLRLCHSSYFLKPPDRVNTENAKQCIRYSIPKLINEFDSDFITAISRLSIQTIKTKFKQIMIPKYLSVCTVNQCYACNWTPNIN